MSYLETKRNALMNATEQGLPSEYQEVDYIESSGTQYIDTDFYNTATTSYIIEFSTKASTSDTNLFGGRSGYYGKTQVVFINTSNNRGIAVHFATKQDMRVDTGWIYTSNIIDTKTKLDVQNTLSNTTIQVNNNIIYTNNTSKTDFTSSISSCLFGRKQDSSVYQMGKFKIYSCKLYNTGDLEKDLVPCYRKSDNEVGMYDLVTNTFFTNSGSGSFTYGTEV